MDDSGGHGGPLSINTAMDPSHSMMSDDMSEPSSPETTFDENDLLNSSVHDDVTAQLAAAGPIGVAAAAAISSAKKRRRQHSFETNPSVRKRQQTRLLRKLRAILEEYTTRVGQQAIILCCTPGKPNQAFQSYKVFGSQPLENVIRNCRGTIMQDLESALALQAPPQQPDDPGLHELPPLVLDGIPTPVDKMTQAQLRAFIPLMLKCSTGRGKPGWGKNSLKPVWWPVDLPWANVRVDVRSEEEKQKALLRAFIPEMLKYSTGRSKPGWGKPEFCPVWWPADVPWANVRSDVRTEEEKKKVSWTHALRTIVKNCYKHHGREDLMPDFHEENNNAHTTCAQPTFTHPGTVVQTINNPDGTVSIIQIDTGAPGGAVVTHGGTMVTLADGTQAHVVHAAGFSQLQNKFLLHQETPQHEATQAVQTLADVAATHNEAGHALQAPVSVEMNSEAAAQAVATLTEATLSQDGQLILTGDASLGSGDTKYGIVTIPVSMYQSVASGLASLTESGQVGNMHIAMAPAVTNQNGHVPDATHAVEVMTVEQS